MLKVKDYYNAIDEIAPFRLAESWDNVGLIVGGACDSANKVMLALDVTNKVIDEAVESDIDLIITHHPVIFHPLKSLSSSSLVYKLAAHGIAVISAHTNLDIAQGGVNDALAEKIGLIDIKPLAVTEIDLSYKVAVFCPENSAEDIYRAMSEAGAGEIGNYKGAAYFSSGIGRFTPLEGASPAIGIVNKLEKVKEVKVEMIVEKEKLSAVLTAMLKAHPYEEPAYDIFENLGSKTQHSLGRIGRLANPLSPKEFALYLKKVLGAPVVEFTSLKPSISTVALCGGSGNGYIAAAVNKNADAYLTGELDHDVVLSANEKGLCVFKAGHFHTENVVMESLKHALESKIKGADIAISKTCTDEIQGI